MEPSWFQRRPIREVMITGSNALNTERSPFGGCSRLLLNYRTIGAALRSFERRSWPFGIAQSRYIAEKDFRIAVAYISVEVLESYLEDLLDLDLGEERLFIEQPGVQISFPTLAAVAMVFCLLGGALALMAQTSPLLSTLFGCALALLVLGVAVSSHQATRRMRFANLLSQEINNRR